MSDNPQNQLDPARDRHLREIAGYRVYFDWEDFLWDPDDWNEEIAIAMAREDGMDGLNDEQWRVIRFIREFFQYQGRAPMNRDLKKGTGLSIMEMERMFAKGIKLGARRIAGLPNPKSCI